MSERESKQAKADFLKKYGPRALILGGSEGIGLAFASQLAEKGFDLTLVARTASTLRSTAEALRSRHDVDIACHAFDLTGPELEARAGEILADENHNLVIYNAGAVHGVDLFLDTPLEKALSLVQLNCVGPIVFAHKALKPMRERGRGGLILVSSMSGMAGSGYVTTYAASKSFEIVLAEGLHWEMAREGVDVMCLVATLTDTPAMARSGMVVDANADFLPMAPMEVAEGGLNNLGRCPVWYAAGEAAAAEIRKAPRTTLIDEMSRMSARLWGKSV